MNFMCGAPRSYTQAHIFLNFSIIKFRCKRVRWENPKKIQRKTFQITSFTLRMIIKMALKKNFIFLPKKLLNILFIVFFY